MTGPLEHKDERLMASDGADWRDKLAALRDELHDPAPADAEDRGGEEDD